MDASYAFSALGYTGSCVGFRDTEAVRADTAVKYRVGIQNFGLGSLCAGWPLQRGNGAQSQYEAHIGGDFNFPSGGVLWLDAIDDFSKDTVNCGASAGSRSVPPLKEAL